MLQHTFICSMSLQAKTNPSETYFARRKNVRIPRACFHEQLNSRIHLQKLQRSLEFLPTPLSASRQEESQAIQAERCVSFQQNVLQGFCFCIKFKKVGLEVLAWSFCGCDMLMHKVFCTPIYFYKWMFNSVNRCM